MSKLKEQFLEVLKNEPRVTIQEEYDKITVTSIKGLEDDEGLWWCCYDEEDNEISEKPAIDNKRKPNIKDEIKEDSDWGTDTESSSDDSDSDFAIGKMEDLRRYFLK